MIFGMGSDCVLHKSTGYNGSVPVCNLTLATNGLSSVLRIGNFPVDIGVPEFSGAPFVFIKEFCCLLDSRLHGNDYGGGIAAVILEQLLLLIRAVKRPTLSLPYNL